MAEAVCSWRHTETNDRGGQFAIGALQKGSVFNGRVVGWYSQLSSCRQQKILALFFRGYSPWSCYISLTLSDQSRAPHSCLVKAARALKTRPTKRYVSQVQALGIRNNRSSRHWSFPRRRFQSTSRAHKFSSRLLRRKLELKIPPTPAKNDSFICTILIKNP